MFRVSAIRLLVTLKNGKIAYILIASRNDPAVRQTLKQIRIVKMVIRYIYTPKLTSSIDQKLKVGILN